MTTRTDDLAGCPICGSPLLRQLPKYSHAHLMRCGGCRLTFAGRRPTDAELDEHYRGYGNWYDSPITRRRYAELLDAFEPYRRTNRILDLGCGAGYFLAVAEQRGWEACGIEFGEHALKLNHEAGRTVLRGPLGPGLFPDDHFDVVTAFEVIEHLRDPVQEARMIAKVLRADGLLYCTTPNFDSLSRRVLGPRWSVIEYPEHLTYFTATTLKRWLAPRHFAPVRITTTGLSLGTLRRGLRRQVSPTSGAPGEPADEQLRAAIDASSLLRRGKTAANAVLSAARLGDTLKATFQLRE